MGFYVRSLPQKKKAPKWKVQFVSYSKVDHKASNAKKPKKEWDLSKDRWRPLGFLETMSLKEVRARAKQLNAQNKIKKQEDRLQGTIYSFFLDNKNFYQPCR